MKLHKWMEGSEKAGRRALLNGFGGKSKAKAKTSMKKRSQESAKVLDTKSECQQFDY